MLKKAALVGTSLEVPSRDGKSLEVPKDGNFG
jgi:hypothetical protein